MSLFEQRLTSITRFVGSDYNLDVVVAGTGPSPAYVEDNKLIFCLDQMQGLARSSSIDDIKGLVYEQAALALHSDLMISRSLEKLARADAENDRLQEYKEVFNSLESRRVSELLKADYAGIKSVLSKHQEDTFNTYASLPGDLGKLNAIARGVDSPKESSIPSDVNVQDYRTFVQRAIAAKDSNEVLEITDELLQKFKFDFKKADPPPQKKSGEGEGEQQKENGSDSNNSEESTEEIKKALSRMMRQKCEAAKTKSNSIRPPTPPDLRIPPTGSYYVLKHVLEKDRVLKHKLDKEFDAPENYYEAKELLGPHIKKMSNKLKDILLLEKARRYLGGFTDGHKFDTTAVSRYISDDDRLFKKRKKESKLDCCITLLVDLSGSMYGPKAETARETCVIMAETLEHVGIPYEILGFSSCVTTRQDSEAVPSFTSYGSGRSESLDHAVIKDYDKSLDVIAKGRIGAISGYGNNYDSEGLLWAYSRIRLRPEARKIIIVLSDGYPAGYGVHRSDMNYHLKMVCGAIESKPQYNLVGIGYLSDSASKFYKNHIKITKTEDLPEKLLGILNELMLKEKKRGR